MAAKPMQLVVATTTFHTPHGTLVAEHALYDAAHPVVCAHPDLFRPAEDLAIRS
jgi:hypothetical protein